MRDIQSLNGGERFTIPDPINLAAVLCDLPPRRPELIYGILRQGHKMMIAARSKAGKSFLVMELALAVATGTRWLGFNCKKGKVLYVNCELDDISCANRFHDIAAKKGIIDTSGITVWNLRGAITPDETFCPSLMAAIAEMVEQKNYALVIVDPIYKLFVGSENNQEVVGAFCNALDLVAKAGASVVYVHHHSKGAQGDKMSIDRASGSGVFARDADTIVDLIELIPGDGASVDLTDPGVTGWRAEFTLREFPQRPDLKLVWRYPIHEISTDGRLDDAKPMTSQRRAGRASGDRSRAEKLERREQLQKTYTKIVQETGEYPTREQMAAILGLGDKTIVRYCREMGGRIDGRKIILPDSNMDSN